MKKPLTAPGNPDDGYVTIYRMWITRGGRRIFRPGGRPWPIRIKIR